MKRLDYYWNSINFVSMSLLPVSGLYCLLSSLRKQLYKRGLKKSYRAPVPVIVVGNVTVGGTGKTPLIIELVKQLQKSGKKPAVISRGYGGNASRWPQLVNESTTAEKVGDEPQLIFQHTGCPIVVGPNRQRDIEMLLDNSSCDVILSDDGLQHYALQRDIEIAVVDAQRKFGNGFCIPSGPLRENVAKLEEVDLVILNGGDAAQSSFNMLPMACQAVNQTGIKPRMLSSFSAQSVHAIAGIGHPQRFFSMLESYGIHVIPHEFVDHAQYSQADFIFNDELAVLMTEKDAVKCTEFNLPNHWLVPVEIQLSESAQRKVTTIFNSLFK